MRFGPIVRREWIVSARKPSTSSGRMGSVLALLLVLGAIEACADSFPWDRTTVAAQNQFALRAFAALVGVLFLPALMAVPALIAPGIATERDKKSLDALLTTELSGGQIVAGKFGAGVFRYATETLAGVPLMVAVTFGWGSITTRCTCSDRRRSPRSSPCRP